MMAEGAGFEVYDIGVDQSVEKFMAAAEKCNPDIIGMSALSDHHHDVHEDGDRRLSRPPAWTQIKMAVGGAPISQMFADEIGADGYGANASAAVDLFLRLASRRRSRWPPTRFCTGRKSRRRLRPRTSRRRHGPCSTKFMERIDLLAAKRGLQAADDYLAQWQWSDEEEREGSAREVADAVKAELEAKDW